MRVQPPHVRWLTTGTPQGIGLRVTWPGAGHPLLRAEFFFRTLCMYGRHPQGLILHSGVLWSGNQSLRPYPISPISPLLAQ